MEIYDENGNLVKTANNDGSGFETTNPDIVVETMREKADAARANGNMERWRDIHIRLASNDIEPK